MILKITQIILRFENFGVTKILQEKLPSIILQAKIKIKHTCMYVLCSNKLCPIVSKNYSIQYICMLMKCKLNIIILLPGGMPVLVYSLCCIVKYKCIFVLILLLTVMISLSC